MNAVFAPVRRVISTAQVVAQGQLVGRLKGWTMGAHGD